MFLSKFLSFFSSKTPAVTFYCEGPLSDPQELVDAVDCIDGVHYSVFHYKSSMIEVHFYPSKINIEILSQSVTEVAKKFMVRTYKR